MRRGWKLACNLLVVAVCLFLFWCAEGKPLPLELSYTRALRSHFLEDRPLFTLMTLPADGRILSRDGENLYLYQHEGYWVEDESIQIFPLVEGCGYAMARNNDLAVPLEVYAYEETGRARRAELAYGISYEGRSLWQQSLGVARDGEVFRFCLTQAPDGYTEDGRPYYDGNAVEYIGDVYEVYQGYSVWSDYGFTITFYDGDGTVVGRIEDGTP